jgi:hypothetical protein
MNHHKLGDMQVMMINHCTDPSKIHGCLEFPSVTAGNVVLKCGKPHFMANVKMKHEVLNLYL